MALYHMEWITGSKRGLWYCNESVSNHERFKAIVKYEEDGIPPEDQALLNHCIKWTLKKDEIRSDPRWTGEAIIRK